MHACGHDAHMAIMVGVARTLVDRIWDVSGRYLFVFQPAEEIVSGAKAMIAGGLLDEHHPDSVIGLHITSFTRVGHGDHAAGPHVGRLRRVRDQVLAGRADTAG